MTIKVEGLNELKRSLADISVDARKDLTRAVRSVVNDARTAIQNEIAAAHDNPRKKKTSARAKRSVRTGLRGMTGWVGYAASNPYVAWLDFGGTLKPSPATKTGRRRQEITRPAIRGGRYAYPTVDKLRGKATEDLADRIQAVIDKHMEQP